MEREEMILVVDCCSTYNLDYTFITWLHEHELLQVETVEEKEYIPHYELTNLEQFIRLHYELEINLEGIEAISHLLRRIQQMQQKLSQLKK